MNTSPFSSTPFSPIVSAPFGSSNPFNRSKIAGLQRFTWSSSNHVPFLRHWNAKTRSRLRFVHKFSWEFFFFFRNSSIPLLSTHSIVRAFDDNSLRFNDLFFIPWKYFRIFVLFTFLFFYYYYYFLFIPRSGIGGYFENIFRRNFRF